MNTKQIGMGILRSVVIISLCVVGATLAEDVSADGSDEYRVVGLSDETAQGNVGIGKLYKLCQRSFGRQARMCTTEEVMRSPAISRLLKMGEEGWIQPVIVSAVSVDGDFQVRDISGLSVTFAVTTKQGLSCTQWTQSSGWAGATLARTDQEVLGIDGTFIRKRMCSSDLNVLCCTPEKSKKKQTKDRDQD